MKYSEFLKATGITDEQVMYFSQIGPINSDSVTVKMVYHYMQLLFTRAYIKINKPPKAKEFMTELHEKFPKQTQKLNRALVETKLSTELFPDEVAVMECLRDASAAWRRGYDDTSMEGTYGAEANC